jgi:hypothetical protein
MANPREIYPSFFQNDQLGACPPTARLLFVGLLTLADFNGVIEYRASLFKAAIFPYDSDIKIEPLIDVLEKRGLITLVAPRDMQVMFVWVPRFTMYQKITKREREAGTTCPTLEELGIELKSETAKALSPVDELPLRDPRDKKVFGFPCLKSRAYPNGLCAIPRKKANEWHQTYGEKLNIMEEIRRCRQWVLDKPGRRCEGGRNTISRIGNWLRKADRDGSGTPPLSKAQIAEQRARLADAYRQDQEQAARVLANTMGRMAGEASTIQQVIAGMRQEGKV